MSTLDKLRALHEEVCNSWRRQAEPGIFEAEAEVLNLGFLLLERLVLRRERNDDLTEQHWSEDGAMFIKYYDRVHSQFDSDADIRITEVTHNE